jgi:hypothetical protein
MHVVFHAADEERRAIELFGDAAEIRMERVARGFVAQEWPSSTATRLWRMSRAQGTNEMAATALRLEMFVGRRPRVARASQPWALGRNALWDSPMAQTNPNGIRKGSKPNGVVAKRRGLKGTIQ